MRPLVQTPVLPKQNKTKNQETYFGQMEMPIKKKT
jgi:hypothetical protein